MATQTYWVTVIASDGKVQVRKFEWTFKSTKELDVADLEIWSGASEAVGTNGLQIMGEEPDMHIEILKRGFAKLKSEEHALQRYIEAQSEAKSKRLGIWRSEMPEASATPSTTPISSSPLPDPSKSESNSKKFMTFVRSFEWNSLSNQTKEFIAFWGGLGTLIASIAALGHVILIFVRRRRLWLIFLGPRSVGKTAIFERMFDPKVRPKSCTEPSSTQFSSETRDRHKVNWGKYVVTPCYVETAGGKPGTQLTAMLKRDHLVRRLLRPSGYVWLIVLSSTPKKVNRESLESDKIDQQYIYEQLGYLTFPLSLIEEPRMPKPNLTILCLSKFDLFSEYEPNSPLGGDASNRYKQIFASHVKRISESIADKKTVEVVVCSACEGWMVRELRDLIEERLYPSN